MLLLKTEVGRDTGEEVGKEKGMHRERLRSFTGGGAAKGRSVSDGYP